ncbi:hypothetical protein GUJ93_ZPchr0007g4313 [Zizania palustris]|uniref:Secreted protein n=1 Tax=Zizania palustris TaxID=103762 RepID=A0A8J5SRW3_ZIZPA|nr:hypothetical protein GUJ93_ZPchr0007g4313 [Zizania palustris]
MQLLPLFFLRTTSSFSLAVPSPCAPPPLLVLCCPWLPLLEAPPPLFSLSPPPVSLFSGKPRAAAPARLLALSLQHHHHRS